MAMEVVSPLEKNTAKKVYELNFAGLPFKLRSSHDEATVRELAQFVEGKIQQALATLRSGSVQNAAVLAALNIAEELILLRRRALTEIDRIEEKVHRVSHSLEQSASSRKR